MKSIKVFSFIFFLIIFYAYADNNDPAKAKKDTSLNYISKNISKLLELQQSQLEQSRRDSSITYLKREIGGISGTVKEIADKKWWETWGGWLIAVITIISTYVATNKQTKGNTISNFRVKWIEELRVTYSEYYVSLINVCQKLKANTTDKNNNEHLDKMLFCQTKIKLLLHHKENRSFGWWKTKMNDLKQFIANSDNDIEHVEFWRKLLLYTSQIKSFYSAGAISPDEQTRIDNIRLEMEDLLLTIFKKEWEKAKRIK